MVELDTVKDRLEMAQSAHNRAAEEKDMTNKELERLLEKYDRCVDIVLPGLNTKPLASFNVSM